MEQLTKREQFAAMAMQGMLSNPVVFQVMIDKLPPKEHDSFLAMAAVEQADALIEALKHS